MIVDFLEHNDGHKFQSDVCIVGSGAAGITIAKEFRNTNVSVVVLEAGGYTWEQGTQDIYTSEVVGLRHKGIHSGRARILGGTTTLWAGQTLPLDRIDFRQRSWVADSGWPLARDDLEPYYRRAERTLHLSPIDYDVGRWPFPNPPLPSYDSTKLRCLISQFSPKADFAAAYCKELAATKNITIVLHANVVKLRANVEASALLGVEFRSLLGKTGRATARAYVVCCGGIETARLLLASDDVEKYGLGNKYDIVGRYFQDHLQALLARVRLYNAESGLALFQPFYWRGIAYSPKSALSEKIQQERKTLNATVGVTGGEFVDESSGVEAAKRVIRGVLRRKFIIPAGSDLRRMLGAPNEVLSAAFRRFIKHKPAFRMTGDTYVAVQCECEPNPSSQVALSAELDQLGMPRARLDWRLTPMVRHTATIAVETFAQEMKRLEIGEVELDSFELPRRHDWDQLFWDTNHHIGTCRMSEDPHKGVVNRDCRLHTVKNLFINSSAVFPTSGHSNPTFTIIALGIRLADHLKIVLESGSA